MLRISNNYLKIVPKRHCNMPLLARTLTSHDIRHQFLYNFIKSNDGTFISSGPAVTFDDPLLPCVNAVGNQSSTSHRAFDLQMFGEVGIRRTLSIVRTVGCRYKLFKIPVHWSLSDVLGTGVRELVRNIIRSTRIDSSRLYATYLSGDDEPLKNFIDIEMKNVLENSPKETHPFIVHFLTCASLLESVRLQNATQFCTDRPILVLCSTDGQIKARCCVPPKFVTEKFSANLWITTVADVFETEICPSYGLNKQVCHMKPKILTSVIFDEKLEAAIQRASNFARMNMR